MGIREPIFTDYEDLLLNLEVVSFKEMAGPRLCTKEALDARNGMLAKRSVVSKRRATKEDLEIHPLVFILDPETKQAEYITTDEYVHDHDMDAHDQDDPWS